MPNSDSEVSERAAGQPRLQRWIKAVPLFTSAVAGVLSLVPQVASIFGPFDYTGEVLLVICVIGIIFFAIGIIQGQPLENTGQPPLASPRVIGTAMIVVSPILAFFLWYAVLRLPPDKAKKVQEEVALGDTELLIDAPKDAIAHYRKALQLAPRKGSIRAKIQNAEDYKRDKRE